METIDGVSPQATAQSASLARPPCCLVVFVSAFVSPAPTGVLTGEKPRELLNKFVTPANAGVQIVEFTGFRPAPE
jgi:hypothetical protein